MGRRLRHTGLGSRQMRAGTRPPGRTWKRSRWQRSSERTPSRGARCHKQRHSPGPLPCLPAKSRRSTTRSRRSRGLRPRTQSGTRPRRTARLGSKRPRRQSGRKLVQRPQLAPQGQGGRWSSWRGESTSRRGRGTLACSPSRRGSPTWAGRPPRSSLRRPRRTRLRTARHPRSAPLCTGPRLGCRTLTGIAPRHGRHGRWQGESRTGLLGRRPSRRERCRARR